MKFYDTSSLLLIGEQLIENNEWFGISSITVQELENIKVSSNKDADIKYSARNLLRLLDGYNHFIVTIHKSEYEKDITDKGFEISPDTKILSDAIHSNDVDIFVTNDLALKLIARRWFGNNIESIGEEIDDYRGFLDITPTEIELAEFYEAPSRNQFNCLVNQYLILRDNKNNIIDIRKWTGEEFIHIKSSGFNSTYFGKVEPLYHDIYQQMFCDSLSTNKITMVRGPAGTGKSYLALAYLMSMLEKNKISKIIVFCNTVATANSARLG